MWIILVLILVAAFIFFAMNSKNEEPKKTNNRSMTTSDAAYIMDDAIKGAWGDVTQEQRLASANLLTVFGATCDGSAGQIHQVNDIMASYCGLMNISAASMKASQSKYGSINDIVDVLKTVHNRSFLDQLLYSCFCIVSINKSEQGANALSAIFGKLGYTDDDCVNVIQKINALGQMFAQ